MHNFKRFSETTKKITENRFMDDGVTTGSSDHDHDHDIYYDFFKNESLSILKYLNSVKLNPIVTTSTGDIAVFAKNRYSIKDNRKLISILNSSRQFVKLENVDNHIIRY
ncbi:MAG: hypothetical protein ACRD8Z_13800, partial [Nitrososphaeraceae archaeon]